MDELLDTDSLLISYNSNDFLKAILHGDRRFKTSTNRENHSQ